MVISEINGRVWDQIRARWACLPLTKPLLQTGAAITNSSSGFIYWKEPIGAHAVYGKIGEKWNQLGRERAFGYPITDEMSAPDGIGFFK